MAKSPTSFEVPTEMRDMAERSVGQAKKAFDGFVDAASKAARAVETHSSAVQANSKEIAAKYIGYAETNISAAFEHAQKLVRAKDPQEFVQLHTDFVKTQIAAMQAQLQEFGAAVSSSIQKAAGEAQATVQKAADDAKRRQ